MSAITITVLIDTYNYGHFLQEAIDSVLAQDFPMDQVEILVVDDGSTDDTAERVRKYGSNIRYLSKPNGGQASAFNFGFQHAQGEIVALLDADDYWLPSKLRRIATEFQRHPDAGMVYHALREFRTATDQWTNGPFNEVSGDVPAQKRKILLYTAAQTSALSFRTRVVKELLPLNEGLTTQAEGLLAALIIFLAPVVAVPELLAVYRIHGSNLYQHSSTEIDQRRQLRRIDQLKIFLREFDRWLIAHGFDLQKPEILAYRTRWRHVYETEQFLLKPPGRARFFWHLLRANRNMSPCLNARIQLVNYMNAFGSLLVGYRHYDKLDQWRRQLKGFLIRSHQRA
jgi:glycosyltransferase involved in cell wall biosynthesis